MNISTQARTSPQAQEYGPSTAVPSTLRRAWQTPLIAAVCISPLALWTFVLPSSHGGTQANSNQELSRACANWETAALDAIGKRLSGAEVGREVYARAADRWLAEARRHCAAGSRGRAARYYERLITAANPA